MTTLLICNDLFFQTKIETTATLLGKQLRTVPDLDALKQALKQEKDLQLIIWDLNAGLNLVDTTALIKKHTKAKIVSYLSHVQTELIKKAKDAGIDEVMPRSAFTIKLPDILGKS